MKKLLVLALSAIMVLSMAAVSMAAVVVGGEVTNTLTLGDPMTTAVGGKVKFTATLNDEVSAYTEIKFAAGDFGDTYFKVLLGEGTLQAGSFNFEAGGLDLLTEAGTDQKSAGVTTTYEIPVGDTIKVKIGYLLVEETFGLNVAYASDAIGAGLFYSDDGGYNLNGSYQLSDAFKVYLDYGANADESEVTALGAKYTSESGLGAILEYNMADNADADYALRISYTFENGIYMEINQKAEGDPSVMFKAAF